MFIKTFFTFIKIWIQPKCPSTDEWVKMWCIYIHNGILVIKKNEILPFAIMWVDLEDIMLSEMSDKDKYCTSFICENQKPQQNSEYNNKKKKPDSQL